MDTESNNFIRADSFSLHSIEIYAFLFLLICFWRILTNVKKPLEIKLIYMFALAIPYSDVMFRFLNMQTTEILILFMILHAMVKRKITIHSNYVTGFMAYFLVILSVFLLLSNMFAADLLADIALSEKMYSYLYLVRFGLMIFMVNHVIANIKDQEEAEGVFKYLRFGANIAAAVTIIQFLLFKLGFVVPGIFYMWDFPRAKGLAHEPGTNAFQIISTLVLTAYWFKEKRLKFFAKSFIVQIVAFIICLSTGGFVVLLVFAAVMLYQMMKRTKLTSGTVAFSHLGIATIFVCLFFARDQLPSLNLSNVVSKATAMMSDYSNGSNISGRGGDINGVRETLAHYPLTGIGSFNSVIVHSAESNTNTYFMMISELGLFGVMFLALGLTYLFVKIIRGSSVRGSPLKINLLIFFVVFLISILWLRVLFFPQIWFALALFYVLARQRTTSKQ